MIATSTIVYITYNLVAAVDIVLCGPHPITRHLTALIVALCPSVCQSEHVTREWKKQNVWIWMCQDIKYDFTAELTGTGDRSEYDIENYY